MLLARDKSFIHSTVEIESFHAWEGSWILAASRLSLPSKLWRAEEQGLQVCLDSRSFFKAATLLLSRFPVPLYLVVLSSFLPLIAIFSIQQELSKYFCRSGGAMQLCLWLNFSFLPFFLFMSSPPFSGFSFCVFIPISLLLSPDSVCVCVSVSCLSSFFHLPRQPRHYSTFLSMEFWADWELEKEYTRWNAKYPLC